MMDNREQNELQHYGVLGMKWGVRKAEYYDRVAANARMKEEKAKTRLGKSIYGNREIVYREAGQAARNRQAAKGLGGKYSALFGVKRNATRSRAVADYYGKKLSRSKTKFGRRLNETRKYNAEQQAKGWERASKAKFGFRYLTKIGDYFNSTSKSILSTKELDNGRRYINNLVFGQLIGDVVTISGTYGNKKKRQ